jgi:hypothetical protein
MTNSRELIGPRGGPFMNSRTWTLLKLSPQSLVKYTEYMDQYYPYIQYYYPKYQRTVRPHGVRKAKRVPWPVFPGYLFMRVNSRDMGELVSLPVRAYWIRFGGVIEVVPDVVIERLRKLELSGELVREVIHVNNPYRVGVSVRVHLSVGDILAVVVKRLGDRVVVEAPWCRCVVPKHLLEVA